ncbi:hypothetical protein F0562_028786 [Nyssa sinensis]|uniref:Uncharacterized protein n=1 Tax=Nyssa sinensis TaxID=561372 RepID=A0A5J5B136_9ASTE|nr:hypothetical protein F0562_028786 [Nyssa sinensis]
MDPMPPINHVFSLIVQEEQQKRTNPSSNSSNSIGTMAFAVKIDVAKPGGSDQVTDPFPNLVLPHSSLQAHFILDLASSHVHDPPVTFSVPVDLPIDRPNSNSPIVFSSGPSPYGVAFTSVANIPAIAPSPSGGVVL